MKHQQEPYHNNKHDIISISPGLVSIIAFPVFLIIVVLIGSASCFIHYPEIVKARAVITGLNTQKTYYEVEIDAPQNNALEIGPGQQVQLQVDEYPHHKFGYVKGILDHVDHRKGINNFTAWLYLPEGLVTTRKTVIRNNGQVKADILIIINNMRLLQRVFYSSSKKSLR
jgi:hypothetical protein